MNQKTFPVAFSNPLFMYFPHETVFGNILKCECSFFLFGSKKLKNNLYGFGRISNSKVYEINIFKVSVQNLLDASTIF